MSEDEKAVEVEPTLIGAFLLFVGFFPFFLLSLSVVERLSRIADALDRAHPAQEAEK